MKDNISIQLLSNIKPTTFSYALLPFYKFKFIGELIIANKDVVFNGSKTKVKRLASNLRQNGIFRKMENPETVAVSGFLNVRKRIISWRTEVRDGQPSDRTSE